MAQPHCKRNDQGHYPPLRREGAERLNRYDDLANNVDGTAFFQEISDGYPKPNLSDSQFETNGSVGTHAVMGVGWEKFEQEFKRGVDYESGNGEGSSSQSDWILDATQGRYYRLKADGTYEWSEPVAPTASSNEWTWSSEHKRYYRQKADGTYEWS